jgi:hypothetical protein
MHLTRNQAYLHGYRGFKSLSLRQILGTRNFLSGSRPLSSDQIQAETLLRMSATAPVRRALLPWFVRRSSGGLDREFRFISASMTGSSRCQAEPTSPTMTTSLGSRPEMSIRIPRPKYEAILVSASIAALSPPKAILTRSPKLGSFCFRGTGLAEVAESGGIGR